MALQLPALGAVAQRAATPQLLDIERRAAVFVRENGKPLVEARGELLGVPKRQLMALPFAPELDAGRSLADETVVEAVAVLFIAS